MHPLIYFIVLKDEVLSLSILQDCFQYINCRNQQTYYYDGKEYNQYQTV